MVVVGLGVALQVASLGEKAAAEPPKSNPAATRLISSLEGVYKRQFKSGLVTGDGRPDEVVAAEDVVELVRHDDQSLYFRAQLQFYNGHSCGVYGIARYEPANGGAFVYRAREPAVAGSPACTLSIAPTATHVVLSDAPNGTPTCQDFCGARGSLRDYRIERARKRTIRYLPRLKASRQYQEAVAEYGTGAP